jgi:hypothetical protein
MFAASFIELVLSGLYNTQIGMRCCKTKIKPLLPMKDLKHKTLCGKALRNGANEIRTHDLLHAIGLLGIFV